MMIIILATVVFVSSLRGLLSDAGCESCFSAQSKDKTTRFGRLFVITGWVSRTAGPLC
jgi:hypothetical protein